MGVSVGVLVGVGVDYSSRRLDRATPSEQLQGFFAKFPRYGDFLAPGRLEAAHPQGGPGVAVAHPATLLLSSVTVPVRARTLPLTVALVFRVMLASARTFPTNEVVVPRVAELVTCHHTLQADAPLVSVTDEPLAVVSPLPTWKM